MRGKRRWVRCGIVLALIGALVLLAGCGGSETGPQPSAGSEQSSGGQEAGGKKRGGIFRYVDRAPVSPFGVPWEIVSAGVISALPVLEPLLMMDWKGNVSPKLAERWEVDPDQKTVTLYLRRGVKFHDGTEFNAEAVRFNLEKQKEVGRMPTVESIEVVDPYTVRLNLSSYSIEFLATLAGSLQASPTAIQQNGLEWARYHPVGTGPFKFVEYVRDSHAKFERFDEYWDRGDEGKPYLDGIELRFIQDAQTIRAAFLNGDIDAFWTNDAALASEVIGMGYPVIDGGSGTIVSVLEPSSANPDSPFADRRVREAVYLAIDREAIATALGYGLSEPAYQIAHPEWIFYLQDFQGGRYDPDRARQLLAEAGYPNGFSTRLISSTSVTSNMDYATALQQQLGQVGIRVEIEFVEPSRYQEFRQRGWEGLLTDIYSFLTGKRVINFFLAEDAPSVYKSLRRPDALLRLFEQEKEQPPLSQEDERRIGLEMARAVMEDFTVIPVTMSSTRYIHQPYVKDFTILRWQSYPYWTPAELWLDK